MKQDIACATVSARGEPTSTNVHVEPAKAQTQTMIITSLADCSFKLHSNRFGPPWCYLTADSRNSGSKYRRAENASNVSSWSCSMAKRGASTLIVAASCVPISQIYCDMA